MTRYLTAAEAAAALGVSRPTLYAYVSRKLLRSQRTADAHAHRYLYQQVMQLAQQRQHVRRPRQVARDALDWGLPVVESAICLIRDGQCYYRGRDAVALARSSTLEQIAALLWELPFATYTPQLASPASAPRGRSLLTRFASARIAADTQPDECAALLRQMAAAVLGTAPSIQPIHRQCAQRWQLSPRGADLIRRVLVLCADHELNASSFTVRCVSSTGASLQAAICGGVAALSGPLHGGATEAVEDWWEQVARLPAARRDAWLRQSSPPAGFGHRLYPAGDVRARALLRRLPPNAVWRAWTRAVERYTGLKPSVDFALVAVRRSLSLPRGSAFDLFALGRTVGWLAHALEQRARGQLIRPRAAYSGRLPPKR